MHRKKLIFLFKNFFSNTTFSFGHHLMHLVHRYLNSLCSMNIVRSAIARPSATASSSKYWERVRSSAGDRR